MSGRRWWQTLPGMLTAAAALISAITGLVVAVHQLWPPWHAAASPREAAASAMNASATTSAPAPTTAAVTGSTAGSSRGETGARTAAVTPAIFPAGARAQIDDHVYEFVWASVSTRNPGQLALALRVRMTNESPYDANFWDNSFRLRVGGETSSPTNFLDDVLAGNTTETAEVDFALPADAQRAILLVGDDRTHAIAVPISLAARH